jgi:hypothetical protein
MGNEEKNDSESAPGQFDRRRFLTTSGKFLVYTSPVLTTLLTADKALAVSVTPYFVVEARGVTAGTFAGMPATGDTAADVTRQWTMNPALDDYATVAYQRYFVGINSVVFAVLDSVNVKITWTLLSGGVGEKFLWGPGPDAGSTQTVTVPSGGGTLGISGTIVDSGEVPWPTIIVNTEFSGTVGSVVFECVGGAYSNILKKLTLNIVIQMDEVG